MFVGHIKVLGWPHVAHEPDVAQAWPKVTELLNERFKIGD